MRRIAELDGLRAIAILLVVAWHYLGTTAGPDSYMWRVFILGRTGVDLFFVLSGYLITTILLYNRASPSFFRSFYGRRSFRILPIYYVMFGLYLLGVSMAWAPVLFGGDVPEWTYAVGLQNVWMAIRQDYGALWLGGTWSLAIEEQFYLVFPLIIRLVSVRSLPKILVCIMIVCPFARAIAGVLGDQYAYYVLMPMRADVLAVGALIAWVEFSGVITDVLKVRVRRTLIVTACILPIFVLAIGKHTDRHMAIWGHTYLVALYGSVLFTVLQYQGSRILSVLRSVSARFFGDISYALYLVHLNVWVLVSLSLGVARNVDTTTGAMVAAVSFALSVAICAISYKFFERPLVRFAHKRFQYQKSAPAGLRAAAE